MSNNQRIKDGRRIMEYLNSVKRATTSRIAHGTKIQYRRIAAILRHDLEPSGDAWWGKDQYWHSTRGSLPGLGRELLVERLKAELERAIFGDRPPEWLRPFQEGIRTGMTLEEAWHFAQRRFISLHPELEKAMT